jgi:hypothetical protein
MPTNPDKKPSQTLLPIIRFPNQRQPFAARLATWLPAAFFKPAIPYRPSSHTVPPPLPLLEAYLAHEPSLEANKDQSHPPKKFFLLEFK